MKKIYILSICTAFTLFSCGKDKPLTNESSQNSTSENGDTFTVDTAQSKIEWKGYKILKSDNTSHFGTVKFESGDVTVQEGKLESGKFVANIAKLENVDLKDDVAMKAKLEEHLKSKDFFDVAKFPTASFEITKVSEAPANSDYNTILDGNLTIKGITKPLQIRANVSVKDNLTTIATEPTDINRDDFGMKFSIPAANGILKNEITLQISIKAIDNR